MDTTTQPSALPIGPQGQNTGQVINFGTVRAAPLSVVLEEERKAAQDRQSQPLITGLAGHVRKQWTIAREAKRNTIEPRLYENMRARRGEYDPDKLAAIKAMGGADVYAGLTSVKCRSAAGWIRDVMLGTGVDRPWAIRPTPMPTLPPNIGDALVAQAMEPIKQAMMSGQQVQQQQVISMMSMMKDQALGAIREEAARRADRMSDKMEDQLIEGGFLKALDEFIDDIVTFPTAVIKGPVIRRKPRLEWGPDNQPVIKDDLVKEWERVSPFNIFPSPASSGVDDGYIIEKHRLSRLDLTQLIGVDGYDEGAIRQVLDDFGRGGLTQWVFEDIQQSDAEGKDTRGVTTNPDGLIDALQYWGSVQGQALLDFGMDKKQIPDAIKEYQVEAWLIGPYVIKAVLNSDPLARKPYFIASYEDVPGNFWGNSVADLVRDPQIVVNATARALVNNMGLASGPQVVVNVDRLAAGESITTIRPWRIWQVTNDPSGSNSSPIEFNQPNSNVQELVAVFEKFSELADEYSGIPRYLSGDTTGGAGRTASGLSMLITNAGKSIKQVISNIDVNVMKPMLERLYYYNMMYEDDPDLKGDICIEARGAEALVAKESAQVRRNEFLQMTANPIDMQIVGIEGRAAVLREVASGLDMDTDKIVPPLDVLRQKLQAESAMGPPGGSAAPQGPAPGGGMPNVMPPGPSSSGQSLTDGSPVTDNMGPPKQ